jgi:hypothetical protein
MCQSQNGKLKRTLNKKPAFLETSILPAEAIVTPPPTPVITSELEQLISDQPLPEPEPEFNLPPSSSQPEVELEAPLQKEQQVQPLRPSTRERRQPV